MAPDGTQAWAVFACYVSKHGPTTNQWLILKSLLDLELFDVVHVAYASEDDRVWSFEKLFAKTESHHFPNHYFKDFALFKRFFQKVKNTIDQRPRQIVLINDSCEIVRPFDMDLFRKHETDQFWSLTKNVNGVPPNAYANQVLRSSYEHLQSFFLVFQGKAVEYLFEWYTSDELTPMDFSIKSSNERQTVTSYEGVDRFEIGMSRYMHETHGIPLIAEYAQRDIEQLFQMQGPMRPLDLSFFFGPGLVYLGCPLLKRKRQSS